MQFHKVVNIQWPFLDTFQWPKMGKFEWAITGGSPSKFLDNVDCTGSAIIYGLFSFGSK